LKRLFDLIAALLGLLILLPVLAVVAVAVRLSFRGPVLFRQTRVQVPHHDRPGGERGGDLRRG